MCLRGVYCAEIIKAIFRICGTRVWKKHHSVLLWIIVVISALLKHLPFIKEQRNVTFHRSSMNAENLTMFTISCQVKYLFLNDKLTFPTQVPYNQVTRPQAAPKDFHCTNYKPLPVDPEFYLKKKIVLSSGALFTQTSFRRALCSALYFYYSLERNWADEVVT